MSKCFTYVLLFDFGDFQTLVNESVTGKVRFPPAPLFNFLLYSPLATYLKTLQIF